MNTLQHNAKVRKKELLILVEIEKKKKKVWALHSDQMVTLKESVVHGKENKKLSKTSIIKKYTWCIVK